MVIIVIHRLQLGVSVSGSVFRNPEPASQPFLWIFKHNEVFTYLSTAFSHKVGMGSEFLGTGNPQPISTLSEEAVEGYVNI
jgi:hypothetical protein